MREDRLQEFRASLALRHGPGIGPHTWRALLEHYGSACEAVADARGWRRLGLVRSDVSGPFLAGKWEAGAARELERAMGLGLGVALWSDPEYPPLLRMIPDPPVLLYYRGRVELLRGPSVAIVGSRKYVPEGMLAASRIGSELSAAGITVVSGMAWGIDREAHQAGLGGLGSSVAVLGTGMDRVYPPRNVDVFKRLCEEGLVVTEFAPGTGPEAGNFPVRNRIVSGVSLGVLVAQAAGRSGSRITARLALEQGREVYAFSGPVGAPAFEGCQALVEEGALPVTGAEEILADLAPRLRLALECRDELPRAPVGRSRQARLDCGAWYGAASAPNRSGKPSLGRAPLPGDNAEDASAPPYSGSADAEAPAPPVGRSGSAARAGKPSRGRAPLLGGNAEDAFAPPYSGSADAEAPASPAGRSGSAARAGKPSPVRTPAVPLPDDPDQQAVLAILAGDRRLQIDALGRELGWDSARLSRVLLLMELGGLVRQWPGMQYSMA